MKFVYIPIFGFLLFTLTACSIKDFTYLEKNQYKTVTKIDDEAYKKEQLFQWKISKGDRIEIQAYNQSSSGVKGQLTQLLSSGGTGYTQRLGDEGILIKGDGLVRLPLIGVVKLLGLTEEKAAEFLIKKYKLYLKYPYVSVKILNQKLFVLGEVKSPGPILVTNGTMNLFEALAYTGDLTDFADRTNIKILRGDMRNPEVREINLNDFQAIQYTSLILRPNDLVYIEPRDSKANVAGINEELPFWQLIGSALMPFSTAAIIYGVTN